LVLKSTDQKGVTMTKDHRRPDAQMAQGGLLEDPGFLKEIVERVLQELLEAEMTEHVGALLPTSAQRTAPATVTAISPAPSGRGSAP
jgi:hypothetical protein